MTEFKICRCENIAHAKLNFHSTPFGNGENSFLPAFLTSTRLLSQVWWCPQVLDLSKTSFQDEFFESTYLETPKTHGFSRDCNSTIDGYNKAYFAIQRFLLYYQGKLILYLNSSILIFNYLALFNNFSSQI